MARNRCSGRPFRPNRRPTRHPNALGQRVFKSEPQAEHTLPNQAELGTSFIDWLKKTFGWLFAAAQANATLGQSYLYADDSTGLPSWALLGEYGNGGSKSTGRWEYVWLPTEEDSNGSHAIPVGVYKGGHIYALHTDHLGTPRRASNEAGSLVWQWPISGFGENKPSGYLKATQSSRQALTNEPVLLRATSPSLELNLRYPGQYFDEETGLHYNLHRSYLPGQGRYTQGDPIGLNGGVNRFGYVGAGTLGSTDPLGLWATDAHDYFIDLLFPDLPGPIRDIIKEGSAYADGPKYQTPDMSFMHGMSSNSISPQLSQKMMCGYISNQFRLVEEFKKLGSNKYWFHLGMALHAVMDTTSPAHEGFQIWRGATKDGHRHGPWSTSLENLRAAKQPHNASRTLQRMREAMQGNYGSCGC